MISQAVRRERDCLRQKTPWPFGRLCDTSKIVNPLVFLPLRLTWAHWLGFSNFLTFACILLFIRLYESNKIKYSIIIRLKKIIKKQTRKQGINSKFPTAVSKSLLDSLLTVNKSHISELVVTIPIRSNLVQYDTIPYSEKPGYGTTFPYQKSLLQLLIVPIR